MASKRMFVGLAAAGCAAAFVVGVAAQAGQRPALKFRNDTGSVIAALRLEPIEDGQPRQVLAQALKPGATAAVSADADPDACVYDVKAELTTGEEIDQDAVNLCQLPDRTLILQD